jgi:hypothetical protein
MFRVGAPWLLVSRYVFFSWGCRQRCCLRCVTIFCRRRCRRCRCCCCFLLLLVVVRLLVSCCCCCVIVVGWCRASTAAATAAATRACAGAGAGAVLVLVLPCWWCCCRRVCRPQRSTRSPPTQARKSGHLGAECRAVQIGTQGARQAARSSSVCAGVFCLSVCLAFVSVCVASRRYAAVGCSEGACMGCWCASSMGVLSTDVVAASGSAAAKGMAWNSPGTL